MQLHLKVIDDSLPKQGKANQGKGLFCTSSRTNEVPFIAHELVQHLPTAQCSSFMHEYVKNILRGFHEKYLNRKATFVESQAENNEQRSEYWIS